MFSVSFAWHMARARKSVFNGEIGRNRTEKCSPHMNTLPLPLPAPSHSLPVTIDNMYKGEKLFLGLNIKTKAAQS